MSPQKGLKNLCPRLLPSPTCPLDSLQLGQDSDVPVSHGFSLKPLRTNSSPFPEGLRVGQAHLAQEQTEISPQIPIFAPLASSPPRETVPGPPFPVLVEKGVGLSRKMIHLSGGHQEIQVQSFIPLKVLPQGEGSKPGLPVLRGLWSLLIHLEINQIN